MKQEFVDALYKDFPNLYKSHMWGIQCDDGWEPLIRELSAKLEAWILSLPEASRAETKASQIKEKFGSLRYHIDVFNYDEYELSGMKKLVEEAENKSFHTCEVCGQPGINRPGAYIQVLCDNDYYERKIRRQINDAEYSFPKKP